MRYLVMISSQQPEKVGETLSDILERVGEKIVKNELPSSGEGKIELAAADATYFPTALCRVSPFFILPKRGRKEVRKYIEDMVIADHSWGQILYSGPQLSTDDEDVLLSVLALLGAKGQKYVYEGPISPFLILLAGGDRKKTGGTQQEQFFAALKRLQSAVIELTIYDGKTKGMARRTRQRKICNIIEYQEIDEKNDGIRIVINRFFREMFDSGEFTIFSLAVRRKMRLGLAKAMYRLLTAQRDGAFRGSMSVLAEAFNLKNKSASERRKDFRVAIEDGKKAGVLDPRSRIEKDHVTLILTKNRGMANSPQNI